MVSKALYQVPQNLLKIKLYWKSKFFFCATCLKKFYWFVPNFSKAFRLLFTIMNPII